MYIAVSFIWPALVSYIAFSLPCYIQHLLFGCFLSMHDCVQGIMNIICICVLVFFISGPALMLAK